MFSIYSDGSYDGLILNGYENYRVYHSHNEFAKNHINGIESFWSFAKRRLALFNQIGNGLSNEKFHIHSCEFRWNNKNSDLYKILLKILRESPLN